MIRSILGGWRVFQHPDTFIGILVRSRVIHFGLWQVDHVDVVWIVAGFFLTLDVLLQFVCVLCSDMLTSCHYFSFMN